MLRKSGEDAGQIMERVTVRVMIAQRLPTQFNTREWNTMDFHIIERVLLLS
jgi:hypothetical protein